MYINKTTNRIKLTKYSIFMKQLLSKMCLFFYIQKYTVIICFINVLLLLLRFVFQDKKYGANNTSQEEAIRVERGNRTCRPIGVKLLLSNNLVSCGSWCSAVQGEGHKGNHRPSIITREQCDVFRVDDHISPALGFSTFFLPLLFIKTQGNGDFQVEDRSSLRRTVYIYIYVWNIQTAGHAEVKLL